MAELDAIAETLKKQRRHLKELKDSTSTSRGNTAELVTKIEDLRRRSEETLRRFQTAATESESKKSK
jgi:phage shock protein A